MRTAESVSREKLRGGFYSPPVLVSCCLDRITELLPSMTGLKILEPSAGDGAFLRGLSEHRLRPAVDSLVAVEIDPVEAAKCQSELKRLALPGHVLEGSVLAERRPELLGFDAAVGNPPFVRFQFVGDADRMGAIRIGVDAGVNPEGVSNLWIPVTLAALTALRRGGVFAFIVPTECLTGVSAAVFRSWLLENVEELRVDLFGVGSFPGVLQEVLVISGRRVEAGPDVSRRTIRVVDHGAGKHLSDWKHSVSKSDKTWTSLLIDPRFSGLCEDALATSLFTTLGSIAKFSVSTVTGANSYFCVDDETRDGYELGPWTLPLLPRIRHATGLNFTNADHTRLSASTTKRWLLNFSDTAPDPETSAGPSAYLAIGESEGLPGRYKCRIRSPWYRVPVIAPGHLLLSKRSHRYPRVVVNEAAVTTTDTIYQGRVLNPAKHASREFAASFHNPLTLLSAELNGRSLGGGVLELVPSEVSQLVVPQAPEMGRAFASLNRISRSSTQESDALVTATTSALLHACPSIPKSLMEDANEARLLLMQRRIDRNEGP